MTPEARILLFGVAAVFAVLAVGLLMVIFKRDDAIEQAHKDAEKLRADANKEVNQRPRVRAYQHQQEKL